MGAHDHFQHLPAVAAAMLAMLPARCNPQERVVKAVPSRAGVQSCLPQSCGVPAMHGHVSTRVWAARTGPAGMGGGDVCSRGLEGLWGGGESEAVYAPFWTGFV